MVTNKFLLKFRRIKQKINRTDFINDLKMKNITNWLQYLVISIRTIVKYNPRIVKQLFINQFQYLLMFQSYWYLSTIEQIYFQNFVIINELIKPLQKLMIIKNKFSDTRLRVGVTLVVRQCEILTNFNSLVALGKLFLALNLIIFIKNLQLICNISTMQENLNLLYKPATIKISQTALSTKEKTFGLISNPENETKPITIQISAETLKCYEKQIRLLKANQILLELQLKREIQARCFEKIKELSILKNNIFQNILKYQEISTNPNKFQQSDKSKIYITELEQKVQMQKIQQQKFISKIKEHSLDSQIAQNIDKIKSQYKILDIQKKFNQNLITEEIIEKNTTFHKSENKTLQVDDEFWLVEQQPITQLKQKPFSDWERVLKNLPDYLLNENFRELLNSKLPQLSSDDISLLDNRELKRLYVLMSFLVFAYVRGSVLPDGSFEQTIQVLSPLFSRPYQQVCKLLGFGYRPVVSYAATCLLNWRRLDPQQPISMDNLAINSTFTGSTDEKWFYLVPLKLEFMASPLASKIKKLLKDKSCSDEILTKRFIQICLLIQSSLIQAIQIIKSMRSNCNPHAFYHVIRRFLNGTSNDPTLPHGLLLDDGTYSKEHGASAAQSPFIHLIDAFLDIQQRKYMTEMRATLPGTIQNFLKFIAEQIRVLKTEKSFLFVVNSPTAQALNKAVTQMLSFRKTHMSLVLSFIVEPSKKTPQTLVGTGGTNLVSFLKDRKLCTKKSLIGQQSI